MKKVEIFFMFGDFGLYVLYEHTILQGEAVSLNASKLQSETIVGPSKFSFLIFLTSLYYWEGVQAY